MPLCAVQRGPAAPPSQRTATCEMLLCCLVSPQLEHLPLDPPPSPPPSPLPPPSNPSAFSSIQPEQGAPSSATLCRLFWRTSEKEKQIEATGVTMKQLAELQQFISLDISYLIARQASSRVRTNLARQARDTTQVPVRAQCQGPKVPRGAEFLWLVFSNPVSELLTGEKSPPTESVPKHTTL